MHPRRPSGDLLEESIVLVLQAAVPSEHFRHVLLPSTALIPKERLSPICWLPKDGQEAAIGVPLPLEPLQLKSGVGVTDEKVTVSRYRESVKFVKVARP